MARFDNLGDVKNQVGRDFIGKSLAPPDSTVGPNVMLDQRQYNYYGHNPDTLLGLAAAPRAAFNACEKDEDPVCLDNTRVQVLQQIRTWADGDDERYIFWLSGWAGTGKSTIARTIAREYYDKGCFMASFFFSRGGGDVSHAGKFVGSIAMQLSQRSAAFKSSLVKAISNDEGISSRTQKDQWNELILQPLSKLGAGSFQAPLLIVIDALDECEKESDVRLVLYLLSDSRRLGGLRFRVFITSRPDIPVRHGFSLVPDQDHQDFVLHDISQSVVNGDIFNFLQDALSDVQQKFALTENWPGEEAIRHLVRKSAGLFIWASTACQFIGEGRQLASKRLFLVLQGAPTTQPEEELNKIYTTVLESSVGDHLNEQDKEEVYCPLRKTLGTIVILFSRLPALSLAKLLHIDTEEVRQTLGDLHSILDFPKDPTRPVRPHHPSLRDFLLSPQRCRDPHFWVDEKNAHEALANHCIQLMSQKLNQKDLCGLGDPGARVAQVPSENVAHCLPAELQYACEYWVSHLQRSKAEVDDESRVHRFLREYCVQCLQERRGYLKDDTPAYRFPLHHWLHWLGAFGLGWGMIWFRRLQRSGQYLNHDTLVYSFFRHYWLHWLGAFGLIWGMVWFWRLQPIRQYLNHDALAYTFSRHHWLPWLGALGLGWGITWFWRLQPSRQCLDDGGPVHVFMQQHLLYWLEALSLAGKISEGVRAIQLLEDMVDVRLLKAARGHQLIMLPRPGKVLGFTPLSMTLSDSSSITDQLLRKHLFKHIALPFCFPPRKVLSGNNSRMIYLLGSARPRECKRNGTQRCRRSRAIRTRSTQ
jgi:hypothetical protein